MSAQFGTIEKFENMQKVDCLKNMFKCMLETCDYSTNDKKIFLTHLREHVKHDPEHVRNVSQCCYCKFSANSVENLMIHIVNIHAFDKYGCHFCFYRSISQNSVEFHMRHYHKVKPQEILKHSIDYHSSEFNYDAAYRVANLKKVENVSCIKIFGS